MRVNIATLLNEAVQYMFDRGVVKAAVTAFTLDADLALM